MDPGRSDAYTSCMIGRMAIGWMLWSGCAESEESASPIDSGAPSEQPVEGPCGSEPIGIEAGTGEDAFEPLSDGDPIEVIHGAQDGHHILGSLRLHNTDEIATIHYWIEYPTEDRVVSDQIYRMQLVPVAGTEGCSFESVGMFAYLGRIDPGSATFLDEHVVVHMDVEDAAGRTAAAAVTVIPYLTVVERDPAP